jgi:glycosyltransferase involved in cell wall biosynthesis
VRVGVDARHLAAHRGVARYAGALLDALGRGFPEDQWALFLPGSAEYPAVRRLQAHPNVEIHRHRLGGRPLFGAAAIVGRPRLDRLIGGPLDVVWMPALAPLALSRETPLVLTVQDLSFERRPGDFTAYERMWHVLARPRSLARRAARVIVLAQPTGAELTERWRLEPTLIDVIPPGVSLPDPPTDLSAALARLGLARASYLLAVGAIEPRKAPELLVEAYVGARERGLEAELVFAGEGRLGPRLSAPGVKVLGRVSDTELDALYRGTLALVVPSLLEGYGLPLREALARGVPAVVSDLPVFGDELSPALIRVRPGDADELATALLRLARDADLRGELAAAARATVSDLSWERAAAQTRAVFARAAGQPRLTAR